MHSCISVKSLLHSHPFYPLCGFAYVTPIALRLRELRDVRGWSQAELARRSGVNQSIISRLENGDTRSVSFENLERLAAAVACDPGYLVVQVRSPRRKQPNRMPGRSPSKPKERA